MGKATDYSKARCDKCGKLYVMFDAIYSPATQIDYDQEPPVMLSFRHSDCHVPFEKQLEDLRNKVNDLQERLKR